MLFLHGGFAYGADDWTMAEPYRASGFITMMHFLRGESGQAGHFTLFHDELDDVLAAARVLSLIRSPRAFATSFQCPVRIFYGSEERAFAEVSEDTARRAAAKGANVKALVIPGEHFSAVPEALRQSIAFFQGFVDKAAPAPAQTHQALASGPVGPGATGSQDKQKAQQPFRIAGLLFGEEYGT